MAQWVYLVRYVVIIIFCFPIEFWVAWSTWTTRTRVRQNYRKALTWPLVYRLAGCWSRGGRPAGLLFIYLLCCVRKGFHFSIERFAHIVFWTFNTLGYINVDGWSGDLVLSILLSYRINLTQTFSLMFESQRVEREGKLLHISTCPL